MTARLTIRYEFTSDPGDDFGWLAVTVQTEMLACRGGFWIQWQDVAEMASELTAYPITTVKPFIREWGQRDGTIYQVIVGISLSPANTTGDLDVVVRLADHNDDRRNGQAVFRTHHADTVAFAAELTALMDGRRDEAVLIGRDIG